MDIEVLLSHLKWLFMRMTIINLAIFILAAVLSMTMKNFIVRIHGSMFGLSPEFIKGALYGFLGVYKIVLIVFIFVPWIALLLMP